MDADKIAKLDALLTEIHQRWGNHSLETLQNVKRWTEQRYSGTGFPALDQAIGGIPLGCIVELMGRPTSGMTTLVQKIIQQGQGDKGYAVYVDLESTFDPDYANRCGVDLNRLFLVRPQTEIEALDILRDLLNSSSQGMMVLDLGKIQPDPHLMHRLTSGIAKSGCIVLVLVLLSGRVNPQNVSTGTPAAIRLLVARKGWLRQRGDVQGYRASVTILKSRTPPKSNPVDIDIRFDGVVNGDPM